MIKKIGVLTSGGDAPGMNAAIAGVIKSAIARGIEAYAIMDGYKGLVNNNIKKVDLLLAQDITNRGGTILGSARLPEFKELSVRKKGVENLKKHGIDALVVIGGDGSYMGAEKLTEMGINCVGIPGTIDNDIASSDYTIGFATALDTVINSIDNIRDTIQSHNRCSVIEIMGNACGDLTLYSAIATGAEVISTSQSKLEKLEILKQVELLFKKGKRSVIVLISEKMYDFTAQELATEIQEFTGYDTRANVLGHIQRGGKPSGMDRYLATEMGNKAVEELFSGSGGICIGLKNNSLAVYPIKEALQIKREDLAKKVEVARLLNSQI